MQEFYILREHLETEKQIYSLAHWNFESSKHIESNPQPPDKKCSAKERFTEALKIVCYKDQPNKMWTGNIILKQRVFQDIYLEHQQFVKELIVWSAVSWQTRRKKVPSNNSNEFSSSYCEIWYWLEGFISVKHSPNRTYIKSQWRNSGEYRRNSYVYSRGQTLGLYKLLNLDW